MSNCNFSDTDFDTLGTETNTTCSPPTDLTLSAMVMGNEEAMLRRLIMVLIFLYAYTNQNFLCYLMCINDKLLAQQGCLTDKLVDSLMDNLGDCNSQLEKCRSSKHRH